LVLCSLCEGDSSDSISESTHLCDVVATGVYPTLAVTDAHSYGSASGLSKKQIWNLFSLDKLVPSFTELQLYVWYIVYQISGLCKDISQYNLRCYICISISCSVKCTSISVQLRDQNLSMWMSYMQNKLLFYLSFLSAFVLHK